MSAFTQAELDYLNSQRLGRLATVNASGEPHVVPVAFRYNPELDAIDIGGLDMAPTRKYRDVERTGRAAFVVDDVQVQPWQPHGIEVRGRAEAVKEGGKQINPNFGDALIRYPAHAHRLLGHPDRHLPAQQPRGAVRGPARFGNEGWRLNSRLDDLLPLVGARQVSPVASADYSRENKSAMS
jgi:pyridoxamine 5'-phosphate oxidase family protein